MRLCTKAMQFLRLCSRVSLGVHRLWMRMRIGTWLPAGMPCGAIDLTNLANISVCCLLPT